MRLVVERLGWVAYYFHKPQLNNISNDETQNVASRLPPMNDNLYQDKYRVASTRWTGYDYSQNGIYFITICTQNRQRFFGEIIAGAQPGEESILNPTDLAKRALECWQEIPHHFAFAVPDTFVVMPDHVHGILLFHKPDLDSASQNSQNAFGPQRQNLAAVVRGFKVGVKTWATHQGLEFGWQSSYFDRVIRDDIELEKARRYILNNPTAWLKDSDKSDGLFR